MGSAVSAALPAVPSGIIISGGSPVVAAGVQVYNVKDYGATGGGSADDSGAIQLAIDAAEAASYGVVYLPAGFYKVATKLVISTRIALVGDGRHRSVLVPAAALADFVLRLNDCWWNNTESTDATDTAMVWADLKAGVHLARFGIVGDRAAAAGGIEFYRRNDSVVLEDLLLAFLKGKALAMGTEDTLGLVRETHLARVRVVGCGAAGEPAVDIGVGATAGDGTNQLTFNPGCEIIYPHDIGLRILNARADASIRRIRLTGLELHGQYNAATAPADDLMVLEGDVRDLVLRDGKVNGSHDVGGAKYAAIRLKENAVASRSPSFIRLDYDLRSAAGHGLIVDKANNVRVMASVEVSSVAGDHAQFNDSCTSSRIRYDQMGDGTPVVTVHASVQARVAGDWNEDTYLHESQVIHDSPVLANAVPLKMVDVGGTPRQTQVWASGADVVKTGNENYPHELDGTYIGIMGLNARLIAGTGSPEAAVAAPVGAVFFRTDGGAGTCLYVKESGTGNTGWKLLRTLGAPTLVDVRSISSTDGADPTDELVLVDASGGAVTYTLPDANGNTGRVIAVKKTDASANAVTVDGDGADTIDGAATVDLAAQYDTIVVVSDGTNWHVSGQAP